MPLILAGTKGSDATAARLLFRPDELHLEVEFTLLFSSVRIFNSCQSTSRMEGSETTIPYYPTIQQIQGLSVRIKGFRWLLISNKHGVFEQSGNLLRTVQLTGNVFIDPYGFTIENAKEFILHHIYEE